MVDFSSIKVNKNKEKKSITVDEISSKDIAIIGISCKLPSADNVEDFWCNIMVGKDCIGDFPDTRRNDTDSFAFHSNICDRTGYVKGAYLSDIDKFDYDYFRISPKEASLMSPNQRLFLETAWNTIEDAGYGGQKLAGTRTGVYIGFESDEPYDYKRFIEELDPDSMSIAVPGNLTPIIASRISYLMDLRGPSMSIDTACSSALVAIHTACNDIRYGKCDMALAGSIKINLFPLVGLLDFGVNSSDGRAKTFDDSSDGTGSGEGVAAILLKPLSRAIKDGDNIYAVIKGSAVNQDGSSIGITAPNVLAQEDVIVNAWDDARVDPLTISYIEAHGTGTKLGDPIEIDGIQRAFRRYTDRKQFCAIGSVKTNIGHLDNAAGIAGLIKIIMALKHKMLPPTLHFNRSNRKINFEQSPLYVSDKLRDWKTDGYPRRCGVSSFGFSGTNCHIVVEEYLCNDQEFENKSDILHIFTLSAKSKTVLCELVEEYKKFVSDGNFQSLNDICSTANTGRGHYNYRLAFILKDINDFCNRIRSIDISNNDIIEQEDVFLGFHKVISDNKKEHRKPNELVDNDIKNYSSRIADYIVEFTRNGKSSKPILEKICRLYVDGAVVDWSELYKGNKVRRVKLPTYPFERNRCWVEKSILSKSIQRSFESTGLPMLDKKVSEFMHQELYCTYFSPEKHWMLGEHKIMDKYVLVGTSYLEMAYEACKKYFSSQVFQFENVVFYSPFMLNEDESREVYISLSDNDGEYEFSVASKPDDNWVKHVEGKIAQIEYLNGINYNIDEIKQNCKNENIVPDIDKYNESSVFTFGPRWRNIKGIYIGENELLSYIEMVPEFTDELEMFVLHPSLLDNALATKPLLDKILKKMADNENSIYLPFSYKKLCIFSAFPSSFYSYVRINTESMSSDLLSFNISFICPSGEVFAEIENYTLKRVNAAKITYSQQYNRLFYQTNWVPCKIDNMEFGKKYQSVLVLTDKAGIGKTLVNDLNIEDSNVVEVEFGDKNYDTGHGRYIIKGDYEDYKRLLEKTADKKFDLVIHMSTLTGVEVIPDEEFLEESQKRGVYSLFHLSRALLDRNSGIHTDIILVSSYVSEISGQEEAINPQNASLFGLGKVLNQEYGNLNCKCIDIDVHTGYESILDEIRCGHRETHVAYRHGQRYIEQFCRTDLTAANNREITVNENGVYIITGGVGGIGLEIAKYLASLAKVKIVLVNRSKFLERENWSSILDNSKNIKLCKKIKTILDIEKKGSEVELINADVSVRVDMERLVDYLKEKYGKINGIIHSAGVAGNGFIMNKSEYVFKEVLAPKISGTWLLHQFTSDCELDFFIAFSSVTSLTGAPGQGDYTAANSFLDSFGAYAQKLDRKVLIINWAGWKKTGMAVDNGVNTDGVFKMMSTEQAIGAFDEVCKKGFTRIIIGELNFENQAFDSTFLPVFNLSDELKDEILKKRERRAAEQRNEDRETIKNIVLKGRDDGNYTPTEKVLANIFGSVLHHNEINIYDSLYDLGGDSLIGMKIVNNINKELKIKAEITDLLRHLSVKEFASHLDYENKKKEISEGYESTSIQKVEKRAYYPLSSAQKRLYILDQIEGGGTSYNIPRAVLIEGHIDFQRFEYAFRKVIRRHEALRTSFKLIDNSPVQIVNDNIDFCVDYMECEEEKVYDIINDSIMPFELEKLPLFRAKLIKISAEKFIFILDIHHIISDGTSMTILTSDLINYYQGAELPELKLQYKDYAIWQKNKMQSDDIKRQEAYWINKFNDEKPILNMPTDYPRPPIQSFEGNNLRFNIDSELTKKIKKVASESDTTLYMVLLSAYYVLLSKYTGQEDIIVGSPIAGRHNADLENMIGVFVNTLAMRNQPKQHISFFEFLNSVKVNALEAYQNQDYQFEDLVNKLDLEKNLSRTPLFDTMFVLQNIDSASEIQAKDFKFKTYDIDTKAAKFDFSLTVTEEDDVLKADLEYCSALFTHNTMQSFANRYIKILLSIAENRELKLMDISILSEEEKKQIFVDFNNTIEEYPIDKTLDMIFEEQAEKTPQNIAAIYKDTKLTYEDLNRKANQLANILREKGVKPDMFVGLMVERSLEMIIGILGILKAGGAYLPISPEYPKERIDYILKDSKIKILLVQEKVKHLVKFDGEIIDLQDEVLYTGSGENLSKTAMSRNLAYMIYTSGSTGEPKGTMIEHYSVVNRINWMQRMYPADDRDVIIQKTPYTFDVSVWELFWYSFVGASVYFLPQGEEKDPESIIECIKVNHITIMHFVPSMLNAFLEYIEIQADFGSLSSLKQIFASGEALTLQQVERFNLILYKTLGTRLTNLYGPTEATVDVSYFNCSDGQTLDCVPIGKPIDNINLFIVDTNNNLQPVGIAGELCITGDGLARGYMNKPELTSQKFVPNHFINERDIIVKSEKMYKTGDLGRWRADGNIEFLGRIDHQVKVRGFRIELGEIETKILQYKYVKETVVIARKNERSDLYLCAYIVGDSSLSINILKKHLIDKLPEYMIPPYFVVLESMPLSPNGKVDRKRLPPPIENTRVHSEPDLPKNEVEELLADILAGILSLQKDSIGIQDSFFSLGGDSIKAISLVSAINKKFSTKTNIKDVYKYPVIKELASYINRLDKKEQGSDEGVMNEALSDFNGLLNSILENEEQRAKLPESYEDIYPMSDIQIGMIYNSLQNPENAVYHDQFVYILNDNSFDYTIFKKVLGLLIDKHPILRTNFEMEGFQIPIQIVYEKITPDIKMDYTGPMNSIEQEEYIRKYFSEDRRNPFNVLSPSKTPLWRMRIFSFGDGRIHLCLMFHHALLDGLSIAMFITELMKLYLEYKAGENIIPDRLSHSYKDFVIEQVGIKKNNEIKGYWINELRDYKRLIFNSYSRELEEEESSIDVILHKLDFAFLQRLKNLSAQYNTNIKTVLFAAYAYMMSMISYENEMVVGLVEHARPACEDGDKLLGCFLNTVPVRVVIEKGVSWEKLIRNVDEKLIDSKYYGKLSLFEIATAIGEKAYNKNPIFDTFFNYVDLQGFSQVSVEGLFDPVTSNNIYERTNTLLDFTVSSTPKQFGIKVVYSKKVFDKQQINNLLVYFLNILNEFISSCKEPACKDKILRNEDKELLLRQFNNTKLEYSSDVLIQELFEKQVERTPSSIAAVYKDISMTYDELNNKANQLAYLLREKGIRNGSIVGLLVHHDIDMLIGMLGVLKAGGAYLPINPLYPVERMKYMLEDSKTKIVLTTHSGLTELLEFNGEIIDLKDRKIYVGSSLNMGKINISNDLAFIIYDSDSSGIPEGVMLEHKSIINFINGMSSLIDFRAGKSILNITTITYGMFILETILPLVRGMKVVIADEEAQRDSLLLKKIILKDKIDMLQATPSRLQLLGTDTGYDCLMDLNEIIIGGDVFSTILFNELRKKSKAKLYNMYGTTETTIYSTVKNLANSDEISIGRPICNTQIYILDKNYNLQPIGVVGELYISGDGVSRGYLNKQDMYEEKLIQNPFIKGEKIFRTGDLGRWLPNGEIEFIGRADNQVEIDKKTDDKLPPELDEEFLRSEKGYIAPATEVEKTLVGIWRDILRFETIGINDNFFEIGGNSILLLQMHLRVNKVYPGKVSVAKMFEFPTINKLAKYIGINSTARFNVNEFAFPEFPLDYFLLGKSGPKYSIQKFKIGGDSFQKLIKASKACNLEVLDIMLGTYIYLVSEISGQGKVTVNTLIGAERILPYTVDTEPICSYHELFRKINQIRKETTFDNTYPLEDVQSTILSPDNSKVMPLFVNLAAQSDVYIENYDFTIKIRENIEQIDFTFEYDSNRFMKSKMGEMILMYVKLIISFSNNNQEEEYINE